MSHFVVIVATPEYPTEEVLDRALQPFHEFECTGVVDQYVQEIDITEEARKEYERYTYFRLRDGEGNLIEPYLDQFYRDPTPEEKDKIGVFAGSGYGHGISYFSKDWGDGRGYQTKVRFVPDGMEEVEVPAREVVSFVKFIEDYYDRKPADTLDLNGEHKYGYVLTDDAGNVVKVVKRTNPNSKWDYWRVGGRWAGEFWPKTGKIDRAPLSWEWKYEDKHEPPAGSDICQKSNLDVEFMRQKAINGRREEIEEILERSKGKLTWDNIDEAVREYRASHKEWVTLPEPRPRGHEYAAWMRKNGLLAGVALFDACFEKPDVKEGQTVEEWINAAPYLSAFAFLRDGQWSEKGEMGWFACVSGEKEDWEEIFQQLLDETPDHYWLTAVDCHI